MKCAQGVGADGANALSLRDAQVEGTGSPCRLAQVQQGYAVARGRCNKEGAWVGAKLAQAPARTAGLRAQGQVQGLMCRLQIPVAGGGVGVGVWV
jgi:hypothetical protein